MTPDKVPLSQAKARLSELVDRAEHRQAATIITRHGRPVAVVVPVEDVERLRAYQRSDTRRGLAALFGKVKPSDELADAALAARRSDRRSRPRAVPPLGNR